MYIDHPQPSPVWFLIYVADLLSQLNSSELVVLGDFNLNWLPNDSNDRKKMSDNLNLAQFISEPTKPNLKDPFKLALVDLILCKRKDRITTSGVFGLIISDQCPPACVRSPRLGKSSARIVIQRIFEISVNQPSFRTLVTAIFIILLKY